MKLNGKNHLKMEIKGISEEGSFEGILSPYGNTDHGGDVVEPGAYTKTLKERGNEVPLLWQHMEECPIGLLTLEDRADGLYCKGQIRMELPEGKKAHICLKHRIIKGLSIGYQTVKDSIENGVRHLKEIRLFEGSVVTFPMNDLAMVTAIKAMESKGDFTQELNEIQTLSTFYQMQYALGNALSSAVWADATKDEKIAMTASILEQFTEAFTAFIPQYLDALEAEYGPAEAWSSNITPEIKAFLAGGMQGLTISQTLPEAKAGETTLATEAVEQPIEPGNHSETEQITGPAFKSISDALADMKAGVLAALKG
jgi:uncharacterized protein